MQWLDKNGLADVISRSKAYTRSLFKIGTVGHPGMLAPDGTSITVDENGTISSVFEGGVEQVDNALSTTSTNPVQNNVITECINDMNESLDIVKAHVKEVGNVHGLTLADLGIANVENKSSAEIRGELTKEDIIKALGYEPSGGGSGESTDTLNIVTFADGTDEELKAMVDAHYQGIINIADYWSVGDIRNISLDGMNYEFAIIGFNHDDLYTTINENAKAAVTIQMVNLLNTTYQLNDSFTNSCGWTSCTLRSTMQNTMINLFPNGFRNMIKLVNKTTSIGNKSTTVQMTSDNLWVPSEIEVFGTHKYSCDGEGRQYEYYITDSKRIKQKSAANSDWWLRSPSLGNSNYFCYVNKSGVVNQWGANCNTGIAICLCI